MDIHEMYEDGLITEVELGRQCAIELAMNDKENCPNCGDLKDMIKALSDETIGMIERFKGDQ